MEIKSVILRKNLFLILLFLIIGLIGFYKIRTNWVLIDDGYNVWFVSELFSKLMRLNLSGIFSQLMESTGRFRLIYWLYFLVIWLIGGNNPHVYHLFHTLIFAGIVYFIYKIARKVSESDIAGGISGIIFILTPLNMESWLRLGPLEPLLSLLSLGSLYFLIIKKFRLAYVFLVLAIFSKESSLSLLPGIFILRIFSPKIFSKEYLRGIRRYTLIAFLSSLVYTTILYAIRQGYSTNYSIVNNLSGNLTQYMYMVFQGLEPFIQLALIVFVFKFLYKILRNKKQERIFYYQLIFMVIGISFIVFQLPWKYVLSRYLLPSVSFLSIFIGVELSLLLKEIQVFIANRYKRLIIPLYLITFICFLYYILTNTLTLTYKTISNVYWSRSIYRLTTYLQDNVPSNGNVYINLNKTENTEEYITEMKLHMTVFKMRPDINVSYLPDDLQRLAGYVVTGTLAEPKIYNSLIKEKTIDSYVIKETVDIPIFTTPVNLLKQSTKKVYDKIRYRIYPNLDGIYTTYHSNYVWLVDKV